MKRRRSQRERDLEARVKTLENEFEGLMLAIANLQDAMRLTYHPGAPWYKDNIGAFTKTDKPQYI